MSFKVSTFTNCGRDIIGWKQWFYLVTKRTKSGNWNASDRYQRKKTDIFRHKLFREILYNDESTYKFRTIQDLVCSDSKDEEDVLEVDSKGRSKRERQTVDYNVS